MQKTEIPGIYKEREGVLINKDEDALIAYKKRKMKNQRNELIYDEIDALKKEMKDIKELLIKALNK